MPDTLTVTYGEETFSPIPYNTFRVGPISVAIELHVGETIEQAHFRAWEFLKKAANKEYEEKASAFLEKVKFLRYQEKESVFSD